MQRPSLWPIGMLVLALTLSTLTVYEGFLCGAPAAVAPMARAVEGSSALSVTSERA